MKVFNNYIKTDDINNFINYINNITNSNIIMLMNISTLKDVQKLLKIRIDYNKNKEYYISDYNNIKVVIANWLEYGEIELK